MRVTSVAVRGLFGVFDHDIPMDKPEGVTIIHGPNGFGKTVMLKMIAGALEGDPGIFHVIPFSEFRLTFDNGSTWSLRSGDLGEDSKEGFAHSFDLSITDPLGREQVIALGEVALTPSVARILDRIDHSIPRPYSRTASGWRDNKGGYFTLAEILRLFPAARTVVSSSELATAMGTTWAPLGISVFVVEANRLNSTEVKDRNERLRFHIDDADAGPQAALRIEQYSADIVQRIKNVRSDYAKVTQERDSTFPERLVQFLRANETALEESVIVSKLEELDRKRRNLIALGFLDSEGALGSFKEEDARLAQEALTIYVDDVQQKFSAFDDMAGRTGKLMGILKRRYQYKTLKISRDKGFVVESTAEKK